MSGDGSSNGKDLSILSWFKSHVHAYSRLQYGEIGAETSLWGAMCQANATRLECGACPLFADIYDIATLYVLCMERGWYGHGQRTCLRFEQMIRAPACRALSIREDEYIPGLAITRVLLLRKDYRTAIGSLFTVASAYSHALSVLSGTCVPPPSICSFNRNGQASWWNAEPFSIDFRQIKQYVKLRAIVDADLHTCDRTEAVGRGRVPFVEDILLHAWSTSEVSRTWFPHFLRICSGMLTFESLLYISNACWNEETAPAFRSSVRAIGMEVFYDSWRAVGHPCSEGSDCDYEEDEEASSPEPSLPPSSPLSCRDEWRHSSDEPIDAVGAPECCDIQDLIVSDTSNASLCDEAEAENLLASHLEWRCMEVSPPPEIKFTSLRDDVFLAA
jgi:hypothetical protein